MNTLHRSPPCAGGAWNADGGVSCVMLVCRRLRALCCSPQLWVCLQLTGPVRWLSAPECGALSRRGVRQLVCGAAAAPHAVTSALLACGATLKSVSVELPPSERWAAAMPDVLDALAQRCPALRSLHVSPHWASASDGAPWRPRLTWPEGAVDALCALLRTGRVASLSLLEVAAPPRALAALGGDAGDALRTLRFFPDGGAQLAAARAGAAGLGGLTLLCTSWHVAPRILPAFLAAAPRLARIELHWLRDYSLPRGIEMDALVELLVSGAPPPPPQPQPQVLQGAPPGLLVHGPAPPPPELTVTSTPREGELDACLLALARVARACAMAADAAAFAADADAAAADARPLVLQCEEADKLSAAGIAAARAAYPPLTLAPMPTVEEEEDDDFWHS
jgi:hypothetical protein